MSSPLPLQDLGGHGPLLHLSHANGFPPGSYRLLARSLAGACHVVAFPARPLWPATDPRAISTWRPLARDLVRSLEGLSRPGIVGLGHSLGGVLTLWAAIDRPDLFAALVLVDPVILPPLWLWMLRLLRLLGLHHRQPLVQGALRRRRTWPHRQACFDHYRAKGLFARWSDAALWDYVQAGTRPVAAGGVELSYPPEWEARIYATTPTGIWRDVPRLRLPTLVLRGQHSGTFVPRARDRLARLLPAAHVATIPGAGHLLPMERPAATAAAIARFLDNVLPGAP
jgi:pimeloyl-ACP methyl ester carboxylesterase